MLSKQFREGGRMTFVDCLITLAVIIGFSLLVFDTCKAQSTCSSPAGPINQNIYAPQCYSIQDTSDTLNLCFSFTAPGSILLFASVPPANCDGYTVSATLYDSACNIISPTAFGIVFVTPGSSYTWCGHYVCTGSTGYHNIFCPSYSDFSPLPVTWIYFFGKYNKISACVDLRWATATETNSDHFEVEYSTDAEGWWKFDDRTGAGFATLPHYYHSTDCSPGPTGYYRIKQVDYDGNYTYSTTINVVRDDGTPLPPVIRIYNMMGQLMSRYGDPTYLEQGVYNMQFNDEHIKLIIK